MTTIKKKLIRKPESKNPIKVKRRQYILDKIREISNIAEFPEIIKIDDGFHFINQYKLSQLLNEPLSSPFKCVISKHKYEETQSAQLIEYNGKEYYVCKYCNSGEYLTVSDALCKIMGLGPLKMQIAVFKKLGLKITSYHKEETKIIIEQNMALINGIFDSGEYPYLLKSKLLNLYVAMLEYSIDRLPLKPIVENELVISIPLSSLSIHLHSMKLSGVDKGTLSRKTNLLTLLGLIRKEQLDNLPEYIKKENSKRKQIKSQNKYYDKTYWNFPTLTHEHLLEAENMLKFLKAQHIPTKNLTAAKYKFLLGINRAKELFPAKKFYHAGTDDEYVQLIVEDILRKKGWFHLDEIADGKGVAKKKAPILLDKLLFEEKIKKVKVSNEVRRRYDIPITIHTNCMIYVDNAA